MQQLQTISTSELKDRLRHESDIVLLDVREPHEHAEKNISNSLLIPLGEIPARISELEPYKNREIIIYCRSGNRSGQACAYLAQYGYNVVNLTGGMLKW
jgi:rhodanese-related sulfurtransferase